MKKSITLAALLLALGTSVFASSATSRISKSQDEVAFLSLPSDNGFGVSIDKATASKSVVIVYDNAGEVLFKDVLSKGASSTKGYLINNLETGDYTVEVYSKGQAVKKQMHVYDDGGIKSYFFMQ